MLSMLNVDLVAQLWDMFPEVIAWKSLNAKLCFAALRA